MKKYLMCIILLPTAIFAIFYMVMVKGFYIDFHPNAPVTAAFRTDGKEIVLEDEQGKSVPFVIKGVDVSSGQPGHYSAEFAPKEEDYLRWLTQIGEMGANTVQVHDIMDADFYNALFSYNETHESPLYLLQGMQVSDAANQGAEDAYADDFYGRLKRDSRSVVDIIHGRKVMRFAQSGETEAYGKDLSPWVLGYIVGQEWDAHLISYTNHKAGNPTSYEGAYFKTAPGSSAFEAMLADVMDGMMAYESGKYKTQRLIAFANDPQNDPFEYEEAYAGQLAKLNCVDAEHIQATDKVLSGSFAAYRLYDFCDNFTEYLSEEQKKSLGTTLAKVHKNGAFGGYLELLSAYHTMPVVSSGYGFSTARIPNAKGVQPLTEEAQGEALMKLWKEAVQSGWSGMCISSWQDAWERRSWNTAFATVLDNNYLWHDVQTDGQNYGILDFEPGEEEKVCYVDGNDAEWAKEKPVLETDGKKLYVKEDAEGLYLLIRGENLSETPLYLPIDTTKELGSKVSKSPAAEFDRAADFLLCLDGTTQTRLLVQERYDVLRQNFLEEITGENPFVTFPAKDSPVFVPIRTALRNDALVDASLLMDEEAIQEMTALGIWWAGRLVHGDGNPAHENYNSLADFSYGEHDGEDFVELRLPWSMLNVGDPSDMWIHRDYYEHYGVEYTQAHDFYIGMGDGKARIEMAKMDVKGYKGAPKYHERLKKSYDVIKREWVSAK